jgi:hypothetical protein
VYCLTVLLIFSTKVLGLHYAKDLPTGIYYSNKQPICEKIIYFIVLHAKAQSNNFAAKLQTFLWCQIFQKKNIHFSSFLP